MATRIFRGSHLQLFRKVVYTRSYATASTAHPGIFRRTVKGTFKYVVLPSTFFAASYIATRRLVADENTEPDVIDMSLYADGDAEISALPLVQSLRADPRYKESRPHAEFPIHLRDHSLTTGVLLSPDRLTVPSLVFVDKSKLESVAVMKIGSKLCGHPGIIHGGLLATLLDEGLCHVGFHALPSRLGVTAKLAVNFRSPAYADKIYIMHAKVTKHEGRKAWVSGYIESVPEKAGDKPVVIAESEVMVVQPKWVSRLPTIVNAD
ncbi:Thioesterase/thiol ester dehydrase-isomerase [Kockiozyma suomiensis]|uniref:Thioesterase/thiol ester dehydrase-isomerase n=1 Tax=Kockiozyma suomiensis TaxID=1337062 RepID=UPI003343B83F